MMLVLCLQNENILAYAQTHEPYVFEWKGFCADLLQSLFHMWWSNSRCAASLLSNALVPLLLSLAASLRAAAPDHSFLPHGGPSPAPEASLGTKDPTHWVMLGDKQDPNLTEQPLCLRG